MSYGDVSVFCSTIVICFGILVDFMFRLRNKLFQCSPDRTDDTNNGSHSKEIIEEADFCGLKWKLDGFKVTLRPQFLRFPEDSFEKPLKDKF